MDKFRKTTIQPVRPVFIGNRAPTDHYAEAAKVFVHKEELYQPKNRDQKRRG